MFASCQGRQAAAHPAGGRCSCMYLNVEMYTNYTCTYTYTYTFKLYYMHTYKLY